MEFRKYSQYIKNLGVYFGASIIPMILGLATNPLIAKNMDPEDYATSGYYLSFSTLIGPIIIFYLIHYYIKEYFRRDEQGRTKLYAIIAKATIWFSGIVSLICFGLLFIYLRYFNVSLSFPILPYLALMVFALPLTGLLNLQLAQYRMEKKATAYFRLSTANGILNIILSLVFVVCLKWGAVGKLLAPLMCNAIVFFYLITKFNSFLRVETSLGEFRSIFIFCLPLALSAMLGYFTNGFTTTYLESLDKTKEYGYYIVGLSMAGYLTTFRGAIGNTFQPDVYESTIKRQWGSYAKLVVMQIGCYIVIAMTFIILAPYIISILTAGRYVASTLYAQIMALSTISSGIYYLINDFSIATNHPKLYLYTSILGSIFIITCLPIFVDRWGFYGGAWMNVISFLVFAGINIILLCLQKRHNHIVK